MKHKIIRLGAVGAVVVTTGVMAAGGAVGASPYSYSDDDKGYGNNYSYNDHNDYGNRWNYDDKSDKNGKNYDNQTNGKWNRYEPKTYRSNNSNASFSQWRYEVTTMVSSYNATNWQSSGSNNNWTPQGDNWQADWSNWNPSKWQKNGSSYENWYSQVTSFMSSSTTISSMEREFNSVSSNRSNNY